MHIPLSEIFLVLIISLLVIKPERMPEVAAAVGRWLKWFQHKISKLKQEITMHE